MKIKAILSILTIAALLAAATQTVSAQPPDRPQGQQAQRPFVLGQRSRDCFMRQR